MKKIALSFVILISSSAFAQKRYSPSDIPKMPRMEKPGGLGLRYDVSGSSGTYNGVTYSEINIGLNYQISDWWMWRNAAFQRFGSNIQTVTGLDSSIRFGNRMSNETGGLGMDFFIGPGVRLASNNASAAFAEAGLGFKLGGIYLGVGLKHLEYFKTEQDGVQLPKGDTQVFFAIGGGGNL